MGVLLFCDGSGSARLDRRLPGLFSFFYDGPPICDSPAIWRAYLPVVHFGPPIFTKSILMVNCFTLTMACLFLLVFYSAGLAFCFAVGMEYNHINNGETYLRLLLILFVKAS